jgi:membrane protease YdiL (CAAX protease family)
LRVLRNSESRLTISTRDLAASVSPSAAFRWFWIVFAVTTAFQVLRLGQDQPVSWLFLDYTMRLVALAILALSPVRAVVFRRETLRVSFPQLLIRLLVTGIAVGLAFLAGWMMWRVLPDLSLGQYPKTRGLLYVIDLTAGIALVAVHEELVFRRLARLAFSRLGDGLAMIVTTSLVFALYHWWTGPWNVLMVALVGVLLMTLYRAVGALWPAIVVHYCADLYAFW